MNYYECLNVRAEDQPVRQKIKTSRYAFDARLVNVERQRDQRRRHIVAAVRAWL